MAMSPSPQISPMMDSSRADRQQSKSPAPQNYIPQTKRDRKRSLIRDSYSAIEERFSANKDNYYRIHLQTLQIDMNLIGAADPHSNGILPNKPAEIESLVRESIKTNRMNQLGPDPPAGAGRIYAEFAKECNDAMEERDTALAILHRDVAVKMTDIQSTYNYYKKLAINEHNALLITLRDRLINSITNKKARLTRERDMDVSDSTAMLLHPSQFGITNPSSPGGIQNKRATRNRRDADDLTGYSELNKRKRKIQDRDESPISSRQRYENGSSTPSWQVEKNKLIATQIDSPLYSVEKLFTEKELTMAYNAAAIAAYSYIVRHSEGENSLEDSTHLDTLKPTGTETESKTENAETSAPGSHSMERQASHATRSTRGTFTSGYGIEAFDDINHPLNFEMLTRQIPKIPPGIFQSGSRSFVTKNDGAPPAAGLSSDDITAEVELIRRARQFNDQRGLGRNLESDEQAFRLLSEAAYPKDGRGRERWVASENRENLPFVQK